MTIEKFVRRSQIIAQRLSEIALYQEHIERDGVPQPGNPRLNAVLSAQERLLNAAEMLLDKLPGHGSSR